MERKRKREASIPGPEVGTVLKLLIAAFIVVLAVSFGQAEPLVLDWDSAWRLALEHNETLASSRDEINRANHQVGEAWSAALPSVNFSGTFQHYFQVPQMIFYLPAAMSPSGQKLRIKTQFGSENNMAANVELSQPLYVAGKVGLGLKIAKRYKELTQVNYSLAREDLLVSLTGAFYGVLLADEGVRLSREFLEETEEYQRQVEAMFEQGVVSEYDMIRSEVQVSKAKPMVTEATANRELAYKALKDLLGLDVDREVQVNGDLNGVDPAVPDYSEASRMAIQQRLEFRQLDLQRQLYEGQYKAEKRNWLWPNIFGQLKWETTAQSDDANLEKYEFLGGFGGAIALQIPLFDGFRSSHRAQQVRVNIRNIERLKSQLTRGVRMQVFKARQDLEKAEEELKAAQESLALSEKGYRIAQVRYESGVGTQLEVLDAHRMLSASKVDVLNALYSRKIARAAYDRAIGRPLAAEEE